MLPDLSGLIGALARSRIRFVVIGGVAVAAHGYIRATQDLDIVPDPDRANLDELGNVLITLDARLSADRDRGIDPELRQALYARRNLTLTTALGDLDVVQQLNGVPPWSELATEAKETSIGGSPLLVCSRRHLIAMKRARASLQDQADIAALEDGK